MGNHVGCPYTLSRLREKEGVRATVLVDKFQTKLLDPESLLPADGANLFSMSVRQDARRRNDTARYSFTLNNFQQLVRPAKNTQPLDGASLFSWIVVHEADGTVAHMRIIAALTHDNLATVSRPIDQDRNFFLP